MRRITQLCVSLVGQAIFFGGYAAILLYLNKAIARELSVPATWVQYAGIALIAVGVVGLVPSSVTKVRQWSREANRARESGRGMIAAARKHLSRGSLFANLHVGLVGQLGPSERRGTQLSRSISRAEQPLSHPEIVSEFRSFATEAPNRLPALSDISAVLLHDELRRKLRALSQVVVHLDFDDTTDLQDTLHDIAVHLVPDQPIINIVGHITKPGHAEPPAVAKVRFDLAAYAYYCATLQEVFTDRLDDAHMVKAASKSSGPGSFDALAEARKTFTTDTLLAWNLVTQCRDAWSLQTREPVRSQIYNGQPES